MPFSFRSFLIPIMLFAVTSSNGQVVFTYGNHAVTKEEFQKAFYKNNSAGKADEKAIRDYLDLYSKFKLKVLAAERERLDTLPLQKEELQNFRSQLVLNYVNDEGSVNELVNEAFLRSQKDLRISHIFIPASGPDTAAFVQEAKAKAMAAYAALQKGQPFEEVAMNYSADPTVKSNGGDLGYITVFSLPYEFESLAYQTPLGKYSLPYRSKAGFHIFKTTDERKAFGKIKVAQILLSFPPEADEVTKAQIKKRADSVYTALENGADFGQLASLLSTDNFSYSSEGQLQEFGVGKYDRDFETQAFSLTHDGDISKPFSSEFGIHILKRISATPVISDKSNLEDLRQTVLNDDRMKVAREVMYKKILRISGYKKGIFDASLLWKYTDSALAGKQAPKNFSVHSNTVLFSFAKQKVTVADWLAYRRSIMGVDRLTAGKTDSDLLEDYTEIAAFEYYKNHLEEFDKDFAFQINEFREGNLLFEIMQRKVWTKAASDSIGLRNYYAKHKNEYWWESSASGIYFTVNSDSIAQLLKKDLENNISDWRSLVGKYEGAVIADSGRFEISQLPVQNNATVKKSTYIDLKSTQGDSSVSFVYLVHLFPAKQLRTFDEAKGYVINDYQAYLEKAWLEELKKKYPIQVNEVVLRSLIKNQ